MIRSLAILTACALDGAAHADPANWQAWNRQMNAAPLHNRPLAWVEEGPGGYDCKGFVVRKIRALHDQGVSYDRMQALTVSNGSRVTAHMVLRVDGLVLDNLSPWVQRPSDYRIIKTETALADMKRLAEAEAAA